MAGVQRQCQFNAQGNFTCGAESVSEAGKAFEKFSIASDAVMAYAANKCPDSYKTKPLAQEGQEKVTEISGYDPLYTLNKSVA